MEQGQARVAQSGLCVPLRPTRLQQQEDEVSKWKRTPWRGDRASAALTHRPSRRTATILQHRVQQSWQQESLLEKKEASKTNICTCFLSPVNLLLTLLNKVSDFLEGNKLITKLYLKRTILSFSVLFSSYIHLNMLFSSSYPLQQEVTKDIYCVHDHLCVFVCVVPTWELTD